MADHPLDNPARASLLGPHAHFARRHGPVLGYPADVAPFLALPDRPAPGVWPEVAALLGPGGTAVIPGERPDPPPGWEVLADLPGVQLVDDSVRAESDGEAVALGAADVPEMLALVDRTRPGPFLRRTVEMGSYLGIRRGGRLVAMAGERMHPPGWTEVSAVCTDPGYRGQGLSTRLVRAVVLGIRARGESAFLHAAEDNTGAIRLYESLGFRLRRRLSFLGLRVPADQRVG
jgi:ribosomal protein S18 acetylase RimI-like enzyme